MDSIEANKMLAIDKMTSVDIDGSIDTYGKGIDSLQTLEGHVCCYDLGDMTSAIFHCGACGETFRTICLLHEHLQGHHMSKGCYHYSNHLRTAFPKYDTVCCFTQTVDNDDDDAGFYSSVPSKDDIINCDKPSTKKIRKRRTKVKNHVKPALHFDKDINYDNVEEQESLMDDVDNSVEHFLPFANEKLMKGLEDKCNAPKKNKVKLESHCSDAEKLENVLTETIVSDTTSTMLDSKKVTRKRKNPGKAKDMIKSNINLPKKSLKDTLKKPCTRQLRSGNIGRINKSRPKKSSEIKDTNKLSISEIYSSAVEIENCETLSVISLRCPSCLIEYENQQDLTEHMKSNHSDEMLFLCYTCPRTFTSQQDLDLHNSTKHYSTNCLTTIATDDLVDVDSPEDTDKGSKKSINKKKEVEARLPYTCDVCGQVMPWCKKDVHHRLHSGDRPYMCELCGKGLISQNKLKRHMLIHSEVKKHTCDVCGVGFQMKYKLRMHMHIHTGKKPYLCSICGAEFNHSSNLATHTRCVHLQIKPYECKVCGGTFAKRSQLDDHALSHSSERQFTCRFCGKSFKYHKGLKRHEKSHLDDKVLHCDKCDAQFTLSSDLTEHVSTAHALMPMKCGECKKAFWDEDTFKEHQANQCDKRKFQCAICRECYKVCNQYYTHMLAAHGIEREQAKALHNQSKIIKDVRFIETDPMTAMNPDLNLPTASTSIEEVSRLDTAKVTNSVLNPSYSVRQMVTGLLEGNQSSISTISALTRVATENLRLHSQDIQEEEKLSAILTPINPLIVLDRNHDLNSFVSADTTLIDPSRSTTDTVSAMQVNNNLRIQTENQSLSSVSRDGLLLPNRSTPRIGLINMNDMLGMNHDSADFMGRCGERYQPLNTISLIPISTAMCTDTAALLEHESTMALRRLAQNADNQNVLAGSNTGLVPLDTGSQQGNQSDPQSVTVGYQIQNLY